MNLREQHDALEFFNTLVENLDEGMKALGKKAMLTKVLGGSFADQKICKTCPHRYSIFTLNVYYMLICESCFNFVGVNILE